MGVGGHRGVGGVGFQLSLCLLSDMRMFLQRLFPMFNQFSFGPFLFAFSSPCKTHSLPPRTFFLCSSSRLFAVQNRNLLNSTSSAARSKSHRRFLLCASTSRSRDILRVCTWSPVEVVGPSLQQRQGAALHPRHGPPVSPPGAALQTKTREVWTSSKVSARL